MRYARKTRLDYKSDSKKPLSPVDRAARRPRLLQRRARYLRWASAFRSRMSSRRRSTSRTSRARASRWTCCPRSSSTRSASPSASGTGSASASRCSSPSSIPRTSCSTGRQRASTAPPARSSTCLTQTRYVVAGGVAACGARATAPAGVDGMRAVATCEAAPCARRSLGARLGLALLPSTRTAEWTRASCWPRWCSCRT